MELFTKENPDLVFYAMEDRQGSTMLCAVAADMTARLRATLWSQERPAILTSGTLAVGSDFYRFKEETGLLADRRVTESVSPSPFDYKTNCLLYLPLHPPEQAGSGYFDELAAEIAALLVIPCLPFSRPDALKEKKRAEYPSLRAFIRVVVVPEMQIKLKQGFGRAIRTETDTCVVAILDERAAPGQRHHNAMLAALPELPITSSLEDVVEFIFQAKSGDYFHHEKASDV